MRLLPGPTIVAIIHWNMRSHPNLNNTLEVYSTCPWAAQNSKAKQRWSIYWVNLGTVVLLIIKAWRISWLWIGSTSIYMANLKHGLIVRWGILLYPDRTGKVFRRK